MTTRVDPIELAYDLFSAIACEAMRAVPDNGEGPMAFQLTLVTLASMCVGGAASLAQDVPRARAAILTMVGNAPAVDVLEVIRSNQVTR